jgi:undecaprenyl-diphosphatase
MTSVATTRGTALHRDDRQWWKVPPLDRRGLALLGTAFVAFAVVWTAVGLVVVELWEPSRFGDWDGDVNRWFEDRRTAAWDDVTRITSMLSATPTMILLCAVLFPVMVLTLHSWRDWAQIVVGLLLESAIFITAATLVGRDRPDVERLDSVPTNGFPSGHIAAATVFYVGLALVVGDHTASRALRVATGALAVATVLLVIHSRLYRGMHYPTDALAGILLGAAVLVVVRTALTRSAQRRERHRLAGADG